mmetsp:Transcript_36601/g.97900  ORF Transcript_36601/g.97900 Transcript_36601/m.97900 type:complete len:239 (+) Transcript_36601:4284-5000(+)
MSAADHALRIDHAALAVERRFGPLFDPHKTKHAVTVTLRLTSRFGRELTADEEKSIIGIIIGSFDEFNRCTDPLRSLVQQFVITRVQHVKRFVLANQQNAVSMHYSAEFAAVVLSSGGAVGAKNWVDAFFFSIGRYAVFNRSDVRIANFAVNTCIHEPCGGETPEQTAVSLFAYVKMQHNAGKPWAQRMLATLDISIAAGEHVDFLTGGFACGGGWDHDEARGAACLCRNGCDPTKPL